MEIYTQKRGELPELQGKIRELIESYGLVIKFEDEYNWPYMETPEGFGARLIDRRVTINDPTIMSRSPYTYAIHPGFLFSQPYEPVMDSYGFPPHFMPSYVGYAQLIKCYSLDKRDCIKWEPHASRISGLIATDYVHLYPVDDGDYGGAMVKAILKHESEQERLAKGINVMPIGRLI